MSTKRPAIDLMALTTEQAVPMPEAIQRMAPKPKLVKSSQAKSKTTARPRMTVVKEAPVKRAKLNHVKTEDLEALAFKVPPEFRKRFRQRAVTADLKLNELLFAALDAWEVEQGIKK